MASEIRNRFTDTEMQIARETDLPEPVSYTHLDVYKRQPLNYPYAAYAAAEIINELSAP